jgi:hypothetical protein
MRVHLEILRAEGLVSDGPSIIMEARDGTVVEVFEWKSRAAIQKAHANARVQEMWDRYEEVCDYVPLGEVPESAELFSEFRPLAL